VLAVEHLAPRREFLEQEGPAAIAGGEDAGGVAGGSAPTMRTSWTSATSRVRLDLLQHRVGVAHLELAGASTFSDFTTPLSTSIE